MSSKRISLTLRERQAIVEALQKLKNETGLTYQVIKEGQRFYDDIISKLDVPAAAEKPGDK